MKTRLTGPPAETGQAVIIICDATISGIAQIDGPCPNRGRSRMVRLDAGAQLPPDNGAAP
jgi:hypothetical protein